MTDDGQSACIFPFLPLSFSFNLKLMGWARWVILTMDFLIFILKVRVEALCFNRCCKWKVLDNFAVLDKIPVVIIKNPFFASFF